MKSMPQQEPGCTAVMPCTGFAGHSLCLDGQSNQQPMRRIYKTRRVGCRRGHNTVQCAASSSKLSHMPAVKSWWRRRGCACLLLGCRRWCCIQWRDREGVQRPAHCGDGDAQLGRVCRSCLPCCCLRQRCAPTAACKERQPAAVAATQPCWRRTHDCDQGVQRLRVPVC